MSLLIYLTIVLLVFIWLYRRRKHFSLSSESLHKQWLFRLAIFFPLASSLYFMIWLGYPYPFRFDANGYNTFLEINKFSLGILALSPILGAFVVYAHRSFQSEIQIKTSEMQLYEAQKKNKVDMYYSKRKFIQEQLDNIDKGFKYGLKNTNEIYNLAFIIGDDYFDYINTKFFYYINTRIGLILANLDKIIEANNCVLKSKCLEENFKSMIVDSINNIATSSAHIKIVLFSEPEYTNKFNDICSEFTIAYSYYEFTNQDEFDTSTFAKSNLLIIRKIYIELGLLQKLIHRITLCLISNNDIKKYMVNLIELEKNISNYLYSDSLGSSEQ